jgi:hypothetical protein
VGKKEMESSSASLQARDAEWRRLEEAHVWDPSTVAEWSDVSGSARHVGEEVQIGHVFGRCVEKNAELSPDNPARKYKYRVVFQGHRVVNQKWEQAVFQDLGSNPASLAAALVADCYGIMDDNDVGMADAVQAYVQAELTGTPCWIALPKEAWPNVWEGKYQRPVVGLRKALYGHPDSGTVWEKGCDEVVHSVGFRAHQHRMAIDLLAFEAEIASHRLC